MFIKISLTALALLILGFFYTTSTLSATANEITTNQGVTSTEASNRIFLPSLKKELPTIQPTPSPTAPAPTAQPTQPPTGPTSTPFPPGEA
jgi:hypothetical protein